MSFTSNQTFQPQIPQGKKKESSGILKKLRDNFGLGTNLQYSKLEGLTNKTINKTPAKLQFNKEKITPTLPCIY